MQAHLRVTRASGEEQSESLVSRLQRLCSNVSLLAGYSCALHGDTATERNFVDGDSSDDDDILIFVIDTCRVKSNLAANLVLDQTLKFSLH